jgi:hypothetical protein
VTPKPTTTTDIAPIGEKGAYATPPQQTAPWTAPSSMPTEIVAAANKLAGSGLADPRGCTYREIEIVLGDVWTGGGETKKTHGFVFGDKWAVAWNGLVYRTQSVGPAADFRADAKAALDDAKEDRFPTTAEEYFVGWKSVTPIKAMLLARLGEGDLAKRTWEALGVRENQTALEVATGDWLWSLYDRGINAHMRGDSELVIESWRKLPELAKLGKFEFLADIDDVLADERRRASARAPAMDDAALAALAKLSQNDRITKLVAALDQVAARQWGQPGGVSLGQDRIVKALIEEGEPAVEPLIDAFENDTRRTRSVQFWRDFARHRSVIAVYEAAYVALAGILDASFFEAVSTGDHLTARGVQGRREVGKKIREHWAKWKGVPQAERFYRELADDAATPDMWITAALKIVQPNNVQVVPTSNIGHMTTQTTLAPGQKPAMRGESLRAKTSPSVSSLFATRLSSMSDVRHACEMASAFADWDGTAALPHLARLERSTIGAYAATGDRQTAGACIAMLTDARAHAGDMASLAEYGAWIAKASPKDADYGIQSWLAPMLAYPTSPAIITAASTIFRAPSPWVPFLPDSGGSALGDILRLDLYKLDAFRAHVALELADKKKIGTIEIDATQVQMKLPSYTSSQGLDANDPLKPAPGTTMDLRVCDQYASMLEGGPPFKIYWPQAERDRALVKMIAWIKTR